MMTTDRTAIRRGLAVRRTAHRPPWGRRKAGHRSIVAPLAATFAATVAVGIGVAIARAERERRAGRDAELPEHRRHFGLLAGETAAHGLKRIALGQLDLAIELLSGEPSMSPEKAVHETRKALKRLRALMRLLEGEIGSKRAARERAVLRNAGARLAGARDAEVMASTLEAVLGRHPRKLGRGRGLAQLREHLRRERGAAAAQALGDASSSSSAARAQVAEELCALRARVAKWKLPDRSAGRLVRPGLEHIYRAGRTGHRRARARKPSPRAMHKWRKHVKDMRYALEALDVQDQSGRRIAKLARRADGLGEMLGEEHDLMLLDELVRSHKPLRRHKRTRRRLLWAIARRRARLRKRALREGRRLYKRKPERFVRRVRVALRERA